MSQIITKVISLGISFLFSALLYSDLSVWFNSVNSTWFRQSEANIYFWGIPTFLSISFNTKTVLRVRPLMIRGRGEADENSEINYFFPSDSLSNCLKKMEKGVLLVCEKSEMLNDPLEYKYMQSHVLKSKCYTISIHSVFAVM